MTKETQNITYFLCIIASFATFKLLPISPSDTMMITSLLLVVILHRSSSIPLLFIDLSHPIDPNIPYFPTQTRFNFTQQVVRYPDSENSFFYSTNAFVTSEHMGTHIDAPYHFAPNGWKVDEIPIKNLHSINARIIDISKQCQINRNYLITIDDVKNQNLIIPEIDEKTGEQFRFLLVFYTGWTQHWPSQIAYAGKENNIEFPGLSEELANYLITTYGNQLVGVGIDTLSSKFFKIKNPHFIPIFLADYGQSKTYPVHQILARHNKYGLENLALLDILLNNVKNNFFLLDIFPMKITNGTGAPCRIIARIDDRFRRDTNWFNLMIFFFILLLLGFLFKVIYDFKYNPNKQF